MAKAEKIKQLLFFFFKIGLALIVVWILFSRGRQEMFSCLRTFDWRWLIPVFVLQFIQIFFSAWRWQSLARVSGVSLGYMESLSLTMQGNFFSLVIPGGAIGGDVVKMAVVSKRSPSGTRMEGAFSVLMDRIVGMISLFSLMLLLLIPGTPLLMAVEPGGMPRDPLFNMICIAGLALLCIAGLGASLVIFFHKSLHKIPFIRFFMDKGDALSKGAVTRLTAATDAYARHWKLLLKFTVLTTFFVHLLAVAPFACLLWGLGTHLPALTVITAVVVGNIAGLIPFFPGGIGIRDLVTVTILCAGTAAAPDAKSAQLLATALMLFFNLSGAFFFIFDPGRRPAKQDVKNEQQ